MKRVAEMLPFFVAAKLLLSGLRIRIFVWQTNTGRASGPQVGTCLAINVKINLYYIKYRFIFVVWKNREEQ